jgi:hypothetical protein
MSRYVPTADQQAAIDFLRLSGYAVVRQRTYDRVMVDARLLPDDSDRYLIGPDVRRDPERGPHRIVIEIEDRS